MVTDRTGDFLSRCILCRLPRQQKDCGPSSISSTTAVSFSSPSASAYLFDAALPSPPFCFAPAAVAAAAAAAADAPAAAPGSPPPPPATSEASAAAAAVLHRCFPVPAGTFAFLLLAARCAEAQQAIAQQLHPLLAAESSSSREVVQRGRSEAALSAAAEEVSRLLQGVRQQQKQLQQLEQQTRVWTGVEQLAKARQQWEQVESTRRQALGASRRWGFFWRSTPAASAADGAAAGRKGGAADWEESAALAHRRAVVGCLYGSLQALTEELKKKEVAILQAQVEKERYFSAYGLRHSPAKSQDEREAARQGKEAAAKQQPQSAAWTRMQSNLAAAAAARAAEQLVAAQQHVEGKTAKARIRATAAAGGRGGHIAAAEDGSASGATAADAGLRSGGVELGDCFSIAERGGRQAPHRQQQQQEAPNVSDDAESRNSSRVPARSGGISFSFGGTSSEAAAKRGSTSFSVGTRGQTAAGCAFEEENTVPSGEAGEGRAQAEQLLLLEEEEQQLVKSFAQESDIVLDVQRKLQEIIQCMDIFSSKVLEQSAACDYIQELVDVSVEHVTAAEKHLQISLKRSDAYRYYIFLFFIVAGLVLLLLDFLKASSPYL